ncbi:hypothetical protein [Polaromonas sp. CG_23.6]|uniref:hypothetical protein n=1 Tax=Polaromonas sp. CG_23.6 TaxID=2760709 RepID=UPI002475546C|nr:hypothetical protein [Polaromonas sp. CG_23.6]MDH6185511.1 hypothetical protein [Polaromonas sp. CG_23.6]
MKCCTHDCRQGDDCPVRLARLAGLTATPRNTDNSDNSDAIDDFLDDTGLMLLQGIALLVFIVSVILYASL